MWGESRVVNGDNLHLLSWYVPKRSGKDRGYIRLSNLAEKKYTPRIAGRAGEKRRNIDIGYRISSKQKVVLGWFSLCI
jgi:hypothetical protein